MPVEPLKCKICRRLGEKLFIKGERCYSPKCAMVRRPYAPGQRGKRRRQQLSEYAKELREKQKLRYWYNLQEKQLKNYVKSVLTKRAKHQDAASALIKLLESRLDNTVLKMGYSLSRDKARQLVSHGYFLVNDKPMNLPSYQVKKGDVITLKPSKTNKKIMDEFQNLLKKYKSPSWIQFDNKKMQGKIVGIPNLEEAGVPVEMASVFEFYSK